MTSKLGKRPANQAGDDGADARVRLGETGHRIVVFCPSPIAERANGLGEVELRVASPILLQRQPAEAAVQVLQRPYVAGWR